MSLHPYYTAVTLVLFSLLVLRADPHGSNTATTEEDTTAWRAIWVEKNFERTTGLNGEGGASVSTATYLLNIESHGLDLLARLALPIGTADTLFANGEVHFRVKDGVWESLQEFEEILQFELRGVGTRFNNYSLVEWTSVLTDAAQDGTFAVSEPMTDPLGVTARRLSGVVRNERTGRLIRILNEQISAGGRFFPVGLPQFFQREDLVRMTFAISIDDRGLVHGFEYLVAFGDEQQRQTASIRRYAEPQPLPSPR